MRTLLIAALALLPAAAQVGLEELTTEINKAREARLRGDLPATADALSSALGLVKSTVNRAWKLPPCCPIWPPFNARSCSLRRLWSLLAGQ
jgi:hypothetical protein